MKALAGKAQKGDFVVLFFAGHGSQQPARNLGPSNPESDGLDEIFLPRDIGKWSDTAGEVQNAIVDDELGVLITNIRNRGAFVWAIFDTCHSGTITRGIDDQNVRYRDVRSADLGIPKAALDKAAKQAAALMPRTRGGPDNKAAPLSALQNAKVSAGAGGFVAFYAAQSWEKTPEAPLPAHLSAGDPNKRPYGLFSYSLAQVLAMNPAMTYRQLGEQVLHRYRQQVRGQPTPLFEGEGSSLDAPVFGTQAGAQVLQWRIDRTEGLRVPAGMLHELGEGAIFSIVANPADPDKAALGFLQASKIELLHASLTPVAREGKAALDPSKIPAEAYARLVQPNTSFALRVSAPPPAKSDDADTVRARGVLTRLAKEKLEGVAVSWLGAQQSGDVRLVLRGGHLWFLPPSGELIEQGPHKSISIELAKKSEQQISELIVVTLRSIARVSSLLKLASMAGSTAIAQGVDVRMTYERQGKSFNLNAEQVPSLENGDKLKIAIENKLNHPVDVNLLFVDSRYGIQHVGLERFEARAKRAIDIGTVDTGAAGTTLGRESILAIVAEGRAGEAQADFRFLAQPTLLATRSVTGGAPSPLTQLFEAAGFEPERTRSLSQPARTLSATAFRLFNWNAVKK